MTETDVQSTEIKEYSVTEAELAGLKDIYNDVKYPVETTAGLANAKEGRAILRTLRVGLEKKRKEIKGPALEHAKNIDSEAKRITAEIRILEDPIDEQIKDEIKRKENIKAEKDRVEKERTDKIGDAITKIRDLPLAVNEHIHSAKDIKEAIDGLNKVELDDAIFEEYIGQAHEAKQKSLDTLTKKYEDKLEAERKAADKLAEDERIRLDQEAKEAELLAKKNIQEIRDIPANVSLTLSVEELHDFIVKFVDDHLNPELYGAFLKEAETAKNEVLIQLEKMYDDAKKKEADEARLKKEREELELKNEAQDVIAQVTKYFSSCVGSTSGYILQMIRTLECDIEAVSPRFGGYTADIKEAYSDVIRRLNAMHDEVKEKEGVAADLAKRKDEQDAKDVEQEAKDVEIEKKIDDFNQKEAEASEQDNEEQAEFENDNFHTNEMEDAELEKEASGLTDELDPQDQEVALLTEILFFVEHTPEVSINDIIECIKKLIQERVEK